MKRMESTRRWTREPQWTPLDLVVLAGFTAAIAILIVTIAALLTLAWPS